MSNSRRGPLCYALDLAVDTVMGRVLNDERDELVSQARRSACSAAANIVEGSASHGTAELRRSLTFWHGSPADLSYAL